MNMKKIIGCLIIACSCILCTIGVFASFRQFSASEADFKIIVNGEQYEFNNPVVTINNNTYIPLRELCNLIGYNINWDGEGGVISVSNKQDAIFKDDVSISTKGILNSGREYVFYGTEDQKFNIDDYVKKENLFISNIYEIKIKEENIKSIAENVQLLFGLDNISPERARINIYYDVNAESFVFIEDYYGVPQPGGNNIIVVRCKDGLTTMYSSNAA